MATSNVAARLQGRAGSRIKNGANGGIMAGIFFIMFEMIMAAILNGRDTFFTPLRMIGAIILGNEALRPGYSLAAAAITGMMLHLALSFFFGVLFGAVLASLPALARTDIILLTCGAIYGLLLWLINFYLIAPAAGWNWFPEQANQVVEFFAHTIFFGLGSGLCIRRLAVSWISTDR